MENLILWLVAKAGFVVIVAGAVGGGVMLGLRSGVKAAIEEGVKFGFSKAMENHKAALAEELEARKAVFTEEIEAAKTSLKLSEMRFSKQFEALVALRRFYRKMIPKKRHPDMDWGEALEDLANGFSDHIDKLEELLFAYETVLPTKVLEKLETAIAHATDGQFEFDWIHEEDDTRPRIKALNLADQFYDKVREAIKELQAVVDEQMPMRKI